MRVNAIGQIIILGKGLESDIPKCINGWFGDSEAKRGSLFFLSFFVLSNFSIKDLSIYNGKKWVLVKNARECFSNIHPESVSSLAYISKPNNAFRNEALELLCPQLWMALCLRTSGPLRSFPRPHPNIPSFLQHVNDSRGTVSLVCLCWHRAALCSWGARGHSTPETCWAAPTAAERLPCASIRRKPLCPGVGSELISSLSVISCLPVVLLAGTVITCSFWTGWNYFCDRLLY